MSKSNLSTVSKIMLYRIVTFFYVIDAILVANLIKEKTYFDYSGDDQVSSNFSGFRMSIWMWYAGIVISLIAYNIDVKNLKIGNKAIMPTIVILYLIFHIICIFFTTLVTAVAIRVDWIKWFQIISITLFVFAYYKLIEPKQNVSKQE
jgi:hypothetical protein